jgi:hypothetical protein
MKKYNDLNYFHRTNVERVFEEYYFDLRIYRWMNRNKNFLFTVIGFFFAWGIVTALFGRFAIIQCWFWIVFPLVVLGAIDHFVIGLRIRKILNVLKKYYSTDITKSELLLICKDILPK